MLCFSAPYPGGGGGSGITWARVSAAGASPVVWSETADEQIGEYLEIQVLHGVADATAASDALFAAGVGGIGSNGVTDFHTYEVMMQGDAWELNDSTIDGFVQPAGPYTSRVRLRTSPYDPANSIDSAWSNKVADTIVGSVAVFAHTTATDFKNTLTMTNGFKSIQGQQQAAEQSARATVDGADLGQFEVSIVSFDTGGAGNTLIEFGFENGTTDFSAFDARPGLSNSAGVTIAIVGGSNVVGVNWASGGSSQAINAADNHQVGDTFSAVPVRGTNTLKVYRTRAGVTTLLGTVTVANLSTFHRAWAGVKNNEKITGNWGGSAYAAPLGTTGGVIYG